MSFDGQTAGVYAALSDQLLNPQRVSSIVREFAVGNHQLLPAPPLGFVWWITKGFFSTGALATAWRMRVGPIGTGLLVDRRGLAANQVGNNVASAIFTGGVCADDQVTLEISTGPMRVSLAVIALPSHVVRPWRSPQVSDSYVAVTLPEIPEGFVLRQPYVGWQNSTLQAGWGLNGSGAAVAPTYRVTRAGFSFETIGVAVNGGFTRSSTCNVDLPPLRRGDALAIKTSVPTTDDCFFGGMFQLVPEIGLT